MVFIFIVSFMILFLILFSFSKIRLEIDNFKFNSNLEKHINNDYKFIIKLYILSIIPILKISITKSKLERIKLKNKIKKLNLDILKNNKQFDKKILLAIKELNIGIKKIDLYIDLGTENASLTSVIVPAISTVIAIILNKKVKRFEDQLFTINPIYINQNLVNIHISGIFEIKMSHIINMIYILGKKDKKGVKENERTSNRRSYGYSYE